MATIMSMVMASRWLPDRRPCSLPETTIGVAPATTCESPFFVMR